MVRNKKIRKIQLVNMFRIILGFFIVCITSYNVTAQNIEGKWYSGDSSRIYEINYTNGMFEGKVMASSHTDEKPGQYILKNVLYNAKKKRYEGLILALDDGQVRQVDIYVSDETLVLLIKRMILTKLKIQWQKVR